MKSVLLLCTVLGAVSDASNCQADEASMLQGLSTVRLHSKTMPAKDAKSILKNMRDVANSLVDGSDTTMSQDEVKDALDEAAEVLARLAPVIRQQLENAQREIDDAISAFQGCQTIELRDDVGQHAAAVESCTNTLDELRTAEAQQCDIAEDCLCDEARVRTTDLEVLCATTTQLYEVAFCDHHAACNTLHQCHSTEAEVYNHLRADVEAEMALLAEEYTVIEQVRCLNDLSREAITPPFSAIDPSAAAACLDVDVSALRINYPNLPAEPAACPAHQHGEPECVAGGPWTLVLQYGEEAYPMNAGAVGVLNEDVNGFAKLSDEAINALPSGGEAGFDYYKLTSDPPDNGASTWDSMFLRTTNVGGYNDLDDAMGIVTNDASWGVCNAASFDECTAWSSPGYGNRFDTGRMTGQNCNRWFTGVGGLKCYAPRNSNARCFSRGSRCGNHALRANVKVYKLTGQ